MVKPRYSIWIITAALCVMLGMVIIGVVNTGVESDNTDPVPSPSPTIPIIEKKSPDDPALLSGRMFYADPERQVVAAADAAAPETASLLRVIADQPEAVWLNGPTADDPTAERDIATVARTSAAAAERGQVVLYQLYAIPNRDACAEYSKGGFASPALYHDWVQRIAGNLAGEAVFAVEADAIAQTVLGGCLNQAQITERYDTLRKAVGILRQSQNVLAVYLDAGHPEWITDPSRLVAPLKASGIDEARGVAINVSNFVATDKIIPWAAQLSALLGPTKRAIIDTSRNGNGSPGPEVTGDARWCNPSGRAIGDTPTTVGMPAPIDAYVWIKHVGESDGACFGRPSAGTFMTDMAAELVRNRR